MTSDHGGSHEPDVPAATFDEVRLTTMRKRIAAHMVSSKSVSPHVAMAVEIDFSTVDAARRQFSAPWKEREGFSLTYLPFIARAVCDAVVDFPHVNAQLDGDVLRVFPYVNLGVAVDLNYEGLIVPVVHRADALDVAQLARRIRALADLAHARKLTPAHVAGGTYTISNPGPSGTYFTTAIINQPQVAILSTDGVRRRPVVVESDGCEEIVARPIGLLTQSFDHRAFDGAYSAGFLRRLKERVEDGDWVAHLEAAMSRADEA